MDLINGAQQDIGAAAIATDEARAQLESALDVANSFRDRPAGRLRLNVPLAASRLVLPRIVPPFLAQYPEIRLEVIVDDRFVELLQSGCDAGIRYEESMDQDMVAIPIGPRRQRMAAAAARRESAGGRARV